MAIRRLPHGGQCCGISHIQGFPYEGNVPKDYNPQTAIQDIIEDGDGHLFEVALIGSQLNVNATVEALSTLGFNPICRFQNDNSDNWVTVFHLVPSSGKESGIDESEFFGTLERLKKLDEENT